ncbi:cell surface protein [Streptococcus parauberis]|uniref:LPXTG cell wall anchor domain-containing protein n=1 Tax=Streptococcus parauberis TaxID=1348 RepID=A0AAE4L075_9STRE|nr:SspB-related isopeptide-forming adhesin [Streptococcus parauberis]MDT2731025.1 LPXTG cell wall anchor domain-containing protein [Streptococcus parauberis]MDT2749709.1 LPXTG cell wall anchor domain-containing protein [Streptococcus parauberis]OHY31032.1 cell surface protein [Streptococcus parauberis]
MNSNTKGHGFFRKSKAYGLVCGIALAGAFAFSGGNVSADEVTAPAQPQTVVTTLTEPTNNQAEAVTSEALNTAVSTAKGAGVTVNTTGAVSHTDVPSAQADLASQTQAVKDATAKAEANTQAIKDATAKNAQIDAQNKAEAERVAQENKAGQLAVDQQNAKAQAKADATNAQLKADYEAKLAEIKTIEDYNQAVAERNGLAKAQTDATNAQLKADYQVKLDAYNKALADRANLVANDVSFEGYGKSETLNGYGQVTSDVVTVDKNGNYIIKEPQVDTDGTFGNTKVTGKFIYTVTYDEATNKAIIKITGISLNTWQLDLTRQTTAVNRNISTSYKDLAGNVLYTRNFDGLSSIGVQTINKSFALDKEIILSDGETSAELMFLKTEPKWIISAPSTLFAKLTYDTADIPSKPIPPTLVTVTPEAKKPVPNTPPTPNYVTPVLLTFTPQTPTVKPHVSVPEKLVVTVSVHPVVVPVANSSKDVVDEAGKTINGLSVLPNTDLNYVAKQDFSQYKGMTASNDKVAKNFIYIDDYDEKSLDGKSMVVNSIKASNGQDVSSLLEMHHVLSKDALDEKLQAILSNSGLSPVGEFYMWVAKDPSSFFTAYVQKGLDITYNLSFKVNQTFTEGEIVNGVAQIDFGNGYLGNLVVNDLPKPEVHKDVLDKQDGKSINNGTVKLGDEVTYKLEGWVVPTGRSYDLFEYKFVDQLQNTHDLYLKDSVVAKVDITLSDGTVITKGSNLAQYTETVYNKETGRYELAFKKEFLEKVARSSEFGADAFIVVKRIKAGDVYNDYTLYVNGNPVKSNRVVTHTPEDPKPVTPQKLTPKTPALPHTGEASVAPLTAIGAIILSVLGLVGFKKRKEN